MEAKYSTERVKLTRYRLDATVVSALLKGNVEKVIFITNIYIDAKVMLDVRNALLQTKMCREVVFYTGDSLEYWLYQNPDIYQKYFLSNNIETNALYKRELITITERAKFYTTHGAFKESMYELIEGNEYNLCFSMSCTKQTRISIESRVPGISFRNKSGRYVRTLAFLVPGGSTPISLRVSVSTPAIGKDIWFSINKHLTLVPARKIDVLEAAYKNIVLPTQVSIAKELAKNWAVFKKK